MNLTYKITHNGTTRTVNAGPAALVAFERHFGEGVFKAIHAHQRVEQVAWLIHQALLKEAQAEGGPAVKPFDGWLEHLEHIESTDEEDEPVPLAGTP